MPNTAGSDIDVQTSLRGIAKTDKTDAEASTTEEPDGGGIWKGERRNTARPGLVCHESEKVLLVTVGKMEDGPPVTTFRSGCQTTVSCVD